jgi:hypothetical protein
MRYNDEDNSPEMVYHMPTLEEYASKAAFILELGPAKGRGSTEAFDNGLAKSKAKKKLFISVDHQDQIVRRPKSADWKLVIGDTADEITLKKVQKVAGKAKPDIIFIDTTHTYEHITKELPIWIKIAKKETIWLFHDTYMFGFPQKMTEGIKEFAQKNGLHFEELTRESHGLSVMYAK